MEGEFGLTYKGKSAFQRGAVQALRSGYLSVPVLLIRHYRELKVDETDMMLIIHLLTFQEKEQILFPTIEEIQTRMSVSADQIIVSLQSLLKSELLKIEQNQDPVTGVKYEEYNLDPLFQKLASMIEDQTEQNQLEENDQTSTEQNIFTAFEQEFGRPLSPMECETITNWLDEDSYSEPLIRAALKESVFAGKVHFRYIDRILLEWSRNRVRTPDEAKEYAQRFRG